MVVIMVVVRIRGDVNVVLLVVAGVGVARGQAGDVVALTDVHVGSIKVAQLEEHCRCVSRGATSGPWLVPPQPAAPPHPMDKAFSVIPPVPQEVAHLIAGPG